MQQVKTFTNGLLKTSMHLIDEKDKYLQAVENMLLPLLDSLLSSGVSGPYQQQVKEAHRWALNQFIGGGVSLQGASRYDVRLCGWLGKLGRGGTKNQRRWCELSGQTLSYFADEKNEGLELRGCLDLQGVLCRPLPPTRNGVCSFELCAGGGKHGASLTFFSFFSSFSGFVVSSSSLSACVCVCVCVCVCGFLYIFSIDDSLTIFLWLLCFVFVFIVFSFFFLFTLSQQATSSRKSTTVRKQENIRRRSRTRSVSRIKSICTCGRLPFKRVSEVL